MDKIHLVIIDDHPLFREGVVAILRTEPDMEIVGQGDTAEDAIRLSRDLLPDVLILDINIPGGGLSAAQSIASAYPVIKIVMLTGSPDEDNVVTALRAGAQAYVLKGVSARELVNILHTVQAGEGYVTPTLAANLLMALTPTTSERTKADTLNELTEREREILELIATGKSNKEIGLQLHLTEKTIKHYVTNILQKLQVQSRVQAALLAQQRMSLKDTRAND
jgi:two-component system, NarL family, nitrate/nitrite response regulator NarL